MCVSEKEREREKSVPMLSRASQKAQLTWLLLSDGAIERHLRTVHDRRRSGVPLICWLFPVPYVLLVSLRNIITSELWPCVNGGSRQLLRTVAWEGLLSEWQEFYDWGRWDEPYPELFSLLSSPSLLCLPLERPLNSRHEVLRQRILYLESWLTEKMVN